MKIELTKNKDLNLISLDNGNLKIILCDLGASIFSIYLNGKLMTMTPENVYDFKLPYIYHGKTIGRTSNRIRGNIVTIDGEKYTIANNEGNNTLHGGIDGLSNKIFKYKIIEGKNSTKVVFAYSSPDGESGFPGRLNLKITYNLFVKTKKFKINFEAKTNKPTLCNLTNHAFFTLGEDSNESLKLKINSSSYLFCDENDLTPIKKDGISKALDFRKLKCIKKDIEKVRFGKANGYDHCYYLNEDCKGSQIILKSSDISLKIISNFKCCQIYSDNYLNPKIKFVGLPNNPNRSIAIEPSDDFLNRDILRPNEKYKRFITYKFGD